jgi:MFS family permease
MRGTRYRRYLLAILLVLLATNYMDGLALGLVLQDIKGDLALSDTQLGLLSGIAFALFYSIMGIPIARWADRGDRITIIALTATLWSLMVAACASARSFGQLMLLRVGVGIGEAGCVPPAHSLIADHFERGDRPRAVAIYLSGNALSMLLGYFVAGWLNELYGWRTMFMVLGAIGVAPAILARLTLKDPRRAHRVQDAGANDDPSLKLVLKTLLANRTFRHLLYSFSVVYFFSYGIAQWQPAFFIRSYGLKTGELGTWLALIYGTAGLVGTVAGGAWASRYAPGDERRQLKAMAVSYCIYGALSTLVYVSPSRHWAFSFVALGAMVGALTTGPLFATIQTLVPPRMRALSIAIVYFFANLIGLGLGPVAAGALSDLLTPHLGQDALRYALLTLCPGFLWVAWHLWRASGSVHSDLEVLREPA